MGFVSGSMRSYSSFGKTSDMKRYPVLSFVMLICTFTLSTEKSIKLDYFPIVPSKFKDCGALYTYDSIGLNKKKYVVVADFQNVAMIRVAGKNIKLMLKEANLVDGMSVTTFEGQGYVVTLKVKTDSQGPVIDLESGTVEIKKGALKTVFKIHGQSSCDISKQEGNS